MAYERYCKINRSSLDVNALQQRTGFAIMSQRVFLVLYEVQCTIPNNHTQFYWNPGERLIFYPKPFKRSRLFRPNDLPFKWTHGKFVRTFEWTLQKLNVNLVSYQSPLVQVIRAGNKITQVTKKGDSNQKCLFLRHFCKPQKEMGSRFSCYGWRFQVSQNPRIIGAIWIAL